MAKHKKRASIKWEIAAFTIALTVVVVGSLSFFAIDAQKKSLTAEVEYRGKSAAASMARTVSDFMLVKYVLETAQLMKDTASGKGVKYALVVDPSGVIQASSDMAQLKKRYEKPEEAMLTPGGIPVVYDANGDKVIDFTAPVVAKGKVKLGTAHLGISYSIIEEPIKRAYLNLGIITLAALLLGAVGSVLLGITITKPVAQLAKGAEIVGKGNLDHIIMIDSENEIGRLADVFNKMTRDLKNAHAKELQQKTLQRELEIARDIQLSIIPKTIPEVPGYRIHAFYKAAEEVGGDFYDVVELKYGLTGLVVADVSGKGVPAAIITAMFSSMVRSEAREILDPRETILSVNTEIRKKISRGMFVTAFYGVINPSVNTVEMISAGHNETLVYRAATGILDEYAPKGFPIAMGPTELMDGRLEKAQLSMQPGDKMVVYTDGITEAMNKDHKEFGIQALKETVRANGGKPGGDVLASINNAVKDFTAGYNQSDDISVVVLERLG